MTRSGFRSTSALSGSQRDGPTYFCSTVRPCTVTHAHPRSYAASNRYKKFRFISSVSSYERRIFTVSGMDSGSTSRTAWRIAIAPCGSRSQCPPRDFFAIFLTGHARFTSIPANESDPSERISSTPARTMERYSLLDRLPCSIILSAAVAISCGSLPMICPTSGWSSSPPGTFPAISPRSALANPLPPASNVRSRSASVMHIGHPCRRAMIRIAASEYPANPAW